MDVPREFAFKPWVDTATLANICIINQAISEMFDLVDFSTSFSNARLEEEVKNI
jgi:hypothetical protein